MSSLLFHKENKMKRTAVSSPHTFPSHLSIITTENVSLGWFLCPTKSIKDTSTLIIYSLSFLYLFQFLTILDSPMWKKLPPKPLLSSQSSFQPPPFSSQVSLKSPLGRFWENDSSTIFDPSKSPHEMRASRLQNQSPNLNPSTTTFITKLGYKVSPRPQNMSAQE